MGQVIQDVSGLSRWNEEAAAAVNELKRTREAIVNISSNVSRLVRLMEHTMPFSRHQAAMS